MSAPGSGIIAEQFIEKIRTVRGNFAILFQRSVYIFVLESDLEFTLVPTIAQGPRYSANLTGIYVGF